MIDLNVNNKIMYNIIIIEVIQKTDRHFTKPWNNTNIGK